MSSYIMDMRKYVGHRTIIQCAASILCINAQGQLLLGRRTYNHKWGYAGGSVEIDEKVEDCAKREFFEENRSLRNVRHLKREEYEWLKQY
ncbi:MAG: NUDIX domain-containing protein [Lachnospiraceae bacterium]|nr:NUDIX domain-containing protein [Lachnospiraceae bacterium]